MSIAEQLELDRMLDELEASHGQGWTFADLSPAQARRLRHLMELWDDDFGPRCID